MKAKEKLSIRSVSKRFGSLETLENIDVRIGEGEFVSIIGPSGCGKSTLLELTAGLLLPDEGSIHLNGRDIVGKRGYVGYMPQKDVLLPWRTILDNVVIPQEILGLSKAEARKRAMELLPVFGLREFASYYPDQLSGGMRQRASFLRTYLSERDVLLLDEPFGQLDALTRLNMQQWLMGILQRYKKTVLLITHDIDEAIYLSDRVYVLSPRPGTVVDEVTVPIPRPRHPQVTTEREFNLIKSRLMNRLRKHEENGAE